MGRVAELSLCTVHCDVYCCIEIGSVSMSTEVGTNGATTLSRMNFSGFMGHVTIFS